MFQWGLGNLDTTDKWGGNRLVQLIPRPNALSPTLGCRVERYVTHLNGSHAGGQTQASVVTMCHDDASDHAGAHAKAALMHVLQLASLVQESRVECAREVVP